MGRLSLFSSLGIIILLVASCTSQQVSFNREARNQAEYKIVYVKPEYNNDPLQMNTLIREKFEEQGYKVALKYPEKSGKEEGLVLSYDYRTVPDVSEEGRVGRRLKWFRIQVIDNADQNKIASGELVSGILTQSPQKDVAEFITALAEDLRHGREFSERSTKSVPSGISEQDEAKDSGLKTLNRLESSSPHLEIGIKPHSESVSPAKEGKLHTEKTGESRVSETEAKQQNREFSGEKKEPRNPWIPRLKSWGFEDW